MPNPKHYPTYHGYISPAPGNLNQHDRKLLAKVYGTCRERNPGENPQAKSKCARIAWSVVNKYG